jgi:uncharacterized protein YjiS (DUF1127 family)
MRGCIALAEGDIMFKLIAFRSDGAFWPLAQRSDLPGATQPRPATGGVLAAPWRLAKAILTELAARRAAQSLDSLDDRMLRDIGIDRGQIGYAARYGREALMRSRDAQAHVVRWS